MSDLGDLISEDGSFLRVTFEEGDVSSSVRRERPCREHGGCGPRGSYVSLRVQYDEAGVAWVDMTPDAAHELANRLRAAAAMVETLRETG